MEEGTLDMFLDEIEKLEAKIENWTDYENLIVLYGSSSIRLWETAVEDLKPLNVMNLGFGGSSFALCVRYYPRLFHKLKKVSHIIYYGGDNDLEQSGDPERVMVHFKKLLDMTRADFPRTPISAITIKPSPIRTYLQPKIRLTNNLMRKYLTTLPKAYQINIFDSMLDANGVARSELFVDDQLHMNANGYRIWKGVVRKHFGI